jgi:hypothetical protein
MYRNFNETHLMGAGTREGLAIDERIRSGFVSAGEQNKETLDEQDNINKALGYTSYGKYVGFLEYPEDGSNQLLRNPDLYLQIYRVSYQRSWIQVQNTEIYFRKLSCILERNGSI